jgi:hypothetical protein
MTSEVTATDRLRWDLDRVILDHVRLISAQENPVRERQISPTIDMTHQTPTDWRDGIQAARFASAYAHQQMLRYATKARGEGVTWADLAESLGIKSEADAYGKSPAEAAFELVSGHDDRSYRSPTVSWECISCGARVTDRGPYNGHPDDDENGHTESCRRHRADLAAFKAKWADD